MAMHIDIASNSPQATLLLSDRSTAEMECWPSWLLPTTHACANIDNI